MPWLDAELWPPEGGLGLGDALLLALLLPWVGEPRPCDQSPPRPRRSCPCPDSNEGAELGGGVGGDE